MPDGHFLHEGLPLQPDDASRLTDLARASVLCNEAELHHHDGGYVWRGDPTDVAMLTMAYKLGWKREDTLERRPEINSIPFEPERQSRLVLLKALSINNLSGAPVPVSA